MGTDDNIQAIQAMLVRIEHKIENVWGILAAAVMLGSSSAVYYGVDKNFGLGYTIALIAAMATFIVIRMFLSGEFYRR